MKRVTRMTPLALVLMMLSLNVADVRAGQELNLTLVGSSFYCLVDPSCTVTGTETMSTFTSRGRSAKASCTPGRSPPVREVPPKEHTGTSTASISPMSTPSPPTTASTPFASSLVRRCQFWITTATALPAIRCTCSSRGARFRSRVQ